MLKEIIKRIKLPTPEFFIKLSKRSLLIGGSILGIIGFFEVYFPQPIIEKYLLMSAGIFIVIIPIFCRIPVDWNKVGDSKDANDNTNA